ncbi:MBOAT family O-acyltransferase [Ravibacter arvi]
MNMFGAQSMLVWLPVTILIYTLLPQRHRYFSLLFVSIVNLSLLDFDSVIAAISVSVVTYACANAMLRSSHHNKIVWLGIGIIITILLMLFSRDGSESLLGVQFRWIGLSYYGLMNIGFLLDINSGKSKNTPLPSTYILSSIFFPYILAGPVCNIRELTPQFERGAFPPNSTIWIQLKRILYGAFCKIVVADNLGKYITSTLSEQGDMSVVVLATVAIGYSVEIYFDFLGYTEIARGVAGLFGIDIPPNFNKPYLATNTRDFWKRWHMSLTNWFRQYLYIPLGGYGTIFFPLLILFIFTISAIWHGLRLNYLIWGLMHAGSYLLFHYYHRFQQSNHTSGSASNIVSINVRRILFFLWLSATWLVFRTEDLQILFNNVTLDGELLPNNDYYSLFWVLVVSLILLVIDHSGTPERIIITRAQTNKLIAQELVFVDLLILSLFILATGGHGDFLYFKF